jgi:erythromycin esterase-like protein
MPVRLAFAVALAAAAAACHAAPRPAAAPLACPAIAGLDAVLAAHRVLLVGEIHGTTETPAMIGAMACRASASGPVVVALEQDVGDQARLEQAVATGDRAALIAGGDWVRDYQDGRTSVAMADLVIGLHALRAAGRDVSIAAFSVNRDDRERAMADNLRAIVAAHPNATTIVLTGNIHARTSPGVPWDPTFVTTGTSLVAHVPAYSINALADDGATWTCYDADAAHCGVHRAGDPTRRHAPTIRPLPARKDGYDAELDMGAVTASLPAIGAPPRMRGVSTRP